LRARADLSSGSLSFRKRLTLFFLLIVVVPMVAVAALVVQVSGESRTGKADAALSAGLETTLGIYDSKRAEARDALRAAVSDPGLESALAGGDPAVIEQVAAPVAEQTGLRTLVLLATDGEELARVGSGEPFAPAELRVAGGGGAAQTLLGSTTTPRQFVDRVTELTGREVAVELDGRPLASTLPVEGLSVPGVGGSETIEIGGEEQRAASAALPATQGTDFLLTLFAPLEEAGITATEPVVGAALAVFFVVAIVFVLFLLRTLQGQVGSIFEAARRIGGGDFSRKVPVEGDDEMAGLAREFNRMSERLAAQMDELRRQRVELDQSIRRLGEAFASGLDRRALLEVVADTALGACEADAARIEVSGSREGTTEAGRADQPALRAAMRAAESQALRAGGRGEASKGDARALAQALTRAGDPTVVGVMAVGRSGGRAFSSEQREVLRYLVGQVAVSIENISLHELVSEQAVTDELTGLANKRGFQDWMETELARAERFGHELSLLILDIDDFKQVNDTHGHLQGDEVLRTIGRILQRESRGIDQPARYGGEEFTVGLPETAPDGALEVAERVRTRIEETEIPMVSGGGSMRVTASLGVATMPWAADEVEDLIGAADEALYRAKRGGKNRVEVAPARPAAKHASAADGGGQAEAPGRAPAQRP
jgi:diguanylate cyclase (GGDEF)-like protein